MNSEMIGKLKDEELEPNEKAVMVGALKMILSDVCYGTGLSPIEEYVALLVVAHLKRVAIEGMDPRLPDVFGRAEGMARLLIDREAPKLREKMAQKAGGK